MLQSINIMRPGLKSAFSGFKPLLKPVMVIYLPFIFFLYGQNYIQSGLYIQSLEFDLMKSVQNLFFITVLLCTTLYYCCSTQY